MSERLSDTEREVVRMKVAQLGVDSATLYVERILTARLAAVTARAEAAEAAVTRQERDIAAVQEYADAETKRANEAEAKVARVEALPFYGADLFGTEVESVVRNRDLRAALADEETQ